MAIIKNKLITKKDNSHDIVIQKGIIKKIPQYLKKFKDQYSKFCIITDYNVEKLYGKTVLEALKSDGYATELFSIPPGEKAKSRKIKSKIENLLIDKKYGRDTLVIAIGGGVVGDLAGFIAGTYCRGIGLVHIPTTLLAMVDSGIGGKTAVSTSEAKNILGLFYHPKLVLIDPETLSTLPNRELHNGMSEVIKTALILDRVVFEYLEDNWSSIINLKMKYITHIVHKCVDIKSKIVAKDPDELHLRKILNYGHTIGHAIESLSNYTKPHGECIAIGMSLAGEISHQMKILSEKDLDRQNKLIEKLKFDWDINENITTNKILEILAIDKKTVKGVPQFVLLSTIGKVHKNKSSITNEVKKSLLKKILDNSFTE